MDSIENEYYYGTSDSTVCSQSVTMLFFVGTVLMPMLFLVSRASVVFWGCKNCCDTAEESQETTTTPVDLEQYPSDIVLVEALQRHIDNIELERLMVARRKERRMWYEYFTKPWTMVRNI